MVQLGIVFIALFGTLQLDSQSNDDENNFETELEYVRQQSLPDVGRQALTTAYEKFIQRHLEDPRVAEAMLDLASSLTNEIPADGIFADHKTASDWIRKAAERAVVGSEIWIKAQFYVASSFEDLGESRRILDRIAKECNDDLAVLARIEYMLISVCLKEKNLEEAEQHTLAIMNWYDDPKKLPKDYRIKGEIDVLRLMAGGTMMHAWTTVPWTKSERVRKVQEFMDRYAMGGGSLQSDGEIAIRHINEYPDPEPVPTDITVVADDTKRAIFLILNLIVILALCLFWIYRRWWRVSP